MFYIGIMQQICTRKHCNTCRIISYSAV